MNKNVSNVCELQQIIIVPAVLVGTLIIHLYVPWCFVN